MSDCCKLQHGRRAEPGPTTSHITTGARCRHISRTTVDIAALHSFRRRCLRSHSRVGSISISISSSFYCVCHAHDRPVTTVAAVSVAAPRSVAIYDRTTVLADPSFMFSVRYYTCTTATGRLVERATNILALITRLSLKLSAQLQ